MKPLKSTALIVFTAMALTVAPQTAAHETPQNSQDRTSTPKPERKDIMTQYTPKQASVRKAIDDLIQTATTYDVETLDRIYHDDLEVIMIDTEDNLNLADKEAFKGLFRSKGEAGDPPMNTWANFHKIDVQDKKAHVLLSRKNNLSGTNMILLLSIDLVHEDGRWQVTREVIFLRPETETS